MTRSNSRQLAPAPMPKEAAAAAAAEAPERPPTAPPCWKGPAVVVVVVVGVVSAVVEKGHCSSSVYKGASASSVRAGPCIGHTPLPQTRSTEDEDDTTEGNDDKAGAPACAALMATVPVGGTCTDESPESQTNGCHSQVSAGLLLLLHALLMSGGL